MPPEVREDIIHCLDEDEKGMFLTKEEHDEWYNDLHGDETEPQ